MKIRQLPIILICCFFPLVIRAQEKDFGIWYGLSAEHKLSKKLEVDLSANVRTFNNASKVDEAFIEGGLTYSLTKHLSVAGSYRFNENIEDNNSYYIRHKFFLDLKGDISPGNFDFSCRLRFQARIKNYIQHEEDKHPDYLARVKFKATYKTPSFPVDPYLYFESFCPVYPSKTRTFEKNRFSAGLEFKVTRKQSFEAEYIFQRDYLPKLSDINIISINYNIKF